MLPLPDAEPSRWTRRHWLRELLERGARPLSMFTGPRGKWSQLRVVAFMFAVAFIANWPPAPWTRWDWAALTVIVLAPAIDTLFALVPVAEVFGGVGSWLGGLIERKLPSLGTGRETTKEEDLP
jgi:hypothetical protein